MPELERSQAMLAIMRGEDPRMVEMAAAGDTQGITMLVYAMTSILNLPQAFWSAIFVISQIHYSFICINTHEP